MSCERCRASTQRGATLCRDCASDPPRRIRVAIGFMAVYWGAFILFTYGTIATTPSGPTTGLMLFFSGASAGILIGLWRLDGRVWGWAQIFYALFLVLGILGIGVSPLFTVRDAGWLLPLPAFIWFIYHQHDLYLDDLN